MKKIKFLSIVILFLFLSPALVQADNLSERLKGRILLQVEEAGEAWYVEPTSKERYFLGRPADAFNVMRELGIGISNRDFDAFNGYAPERLSGSILLKVEDYGRAYYVNPLDLKMHFLGRPADAFGVMRNLGLGISNENLNKIVANEEYNQKEINNKFKVSRVVDGDTLKVVINDKEETIRLIGVDTPETVHPLKEVEYFGKEASDYVKNNLEDNSVYLESDESQGDQDKHGRLLRYVFLEDKTNFNLKLISEGYAYEYTYNLPYKYQSQFKEAEENAELNKKGLWEDVYIGDNEEENEVDKDNSGQENEELNQEEEIEDKNEEYSCNLNPYCGDLSTCEEAMYYLNSCNIERLDRDRDGIPCESLCK